jgi:AhpD family alkylhydroperoxidase
MAARLQDHKALNGAQQAMLGLEEYIKTTGLEESLLNLVRMRASQINGCAFCMALHSKEALAQGERVDRLVVLDNWRDAPWFSEREQAALAWTEAVTLIADDKEVPDEIYDQARAQFSEQELGDLTLAVIAINGWHRLSVPFRREPVKFTIHENVGSAAD